MTRRPDPYLPGVVRTDAGRVEVGLPPLLVPAEWVAEWWPLIQR